MKTSYAIILLMVHLLHIVEEFVGRAPFIQAYGLPLYFTLEIAFYLLAVFIVYAARKQYRFAHRAYVGYASIMILDGIYHVGSLFVSVDYVGSGAGSITGIGLIVFAILSLCATKKKTPKILFALISISSLVFVSCSVGQSHGGTYLGREVSPESAMANLHFVTPPEAGKNAIFRLELTDSRGAPLTNLQVEHDRLVHVVIVGEDLQSFAHIHPEDFLSQGMPSVMKEQGNYTFEFTFPKAGTYVLTTNARVVDDEFSKTFNITVLGNQSMASVSVDLTTQRTIRGIPEEGGKDRYVNAVDLSSLDVQDGYSITLNKPPVIAAGEPVTLTEHFEKGGAPILDLSIFLGAPMHFVVVREGLDVVMHTHGVIADSGVHHDGLPSSIGPDINLEFTFPAPGTYQIIGQAKRGDEIIYTHFMVRVQ